MTTLKQIATTLRAAALVYPDAGGEQVSFPFGSLVIRCLGNRPAIEKVARKYERGYVRDYGRQIGKPLGPLIPPQAPARIKQAAYNAKVLDGMVADGDIANAQEYARLYDKPGPGDIIEYTCSACGCSCLAVEADFGQFVDNLWQERIVVHSKCHNAPVTARHI